MNMNNNENTGAGAGAGAGAAAPRRSTREKKAPAIYSPLRNSRKATHKNKFVKLHRNRMRASIQTRRKPAAPKRTLAGKELMKHEDLMVKAKQLMIRAREQNAKGFPEVAKDLRAQARQTFGEAHGMLRNMKLPSSNRNVNANMNTLLGAMSGLHM